MGHPQISRVDLNDYLSIERANDQRYEYHGGELFAM